MKVTLMLCDFAQTSEGKLNIIGGGWSVRGALSPMSIALKIEVPWHESNRPHQWRLKLLDADGNAVMLGDPAGGGEPFEIEGQFEVGRPPGLPEGTPLDLPIGVNFQPFPLPPGRRFLWELSIDGATRDDWHVAFLTRPNPS